MLKSKVGYSVLPDAYAAGIAAAKMATDGLDAKVGFLYTSVAYDQKKLLEGVRSVTKKLHLVGCTSNSAVIVPDGILDNPNGYVALLAIGGDDLTIGTAACDAGKNARETGAEVARSALKSANRTYAPNYFFMSAAPAQEEEFVKGIQDVIGRVPFFGGSGADNDLTGKWQMFNEDVITTNGVTVAFIYTKKKVATTYTGAYRETKDMGVITAVNNNRQLVSIDGIPALKKYARWRHMWTKELMGGNMLTASITSPLAVKDRLGDLAAIRHPMGGNPDYSINIGNKLAVGTCVVRMEASVDELIAATKDVLKETKKELTDPACYMLIHCGGRKIAIGTRVNEVYKNVKAVAGNVPFVMAFTFGEYGYTKDCQFNTCGGLMLSFTGFDK